MSSFCKKCGSFVDGNTCSKCGYEFKAQVSHSVGATHCPKCKKLVDMDAGFCPYCGNDMNEDTSDETQICAYCGNSMAPGAVFCPSCGNEKSAQTIYMCPNCGREMRENLPFCPGCGISRDNAGAMNRGVCMRCGKKVMPNDAFCPSCGQSTGRSAYINPTPRFGTGYGEYYAKSPTEILTIREKAVGIVWLVVAVLQALLAFYLFDNSWQWGEYSWISVAVIAIWNVSGAYQSFQRARRVEARISGIVAEYRETFTSNVVCIVFNLVFGGFIGVVGGVFGLLNRDYAMRNASYLEDRR